MMCLIRSLNFPLNLALCSLATETDVWDYIRLNVISFRKKKAFKEGFIMWIFSRGTVNDRKQWLQ